MTFLTLTVRQNVRHPPRQHRPLPRSDKVVGPFFARPPQRHLVRNAEESMMNSVIYIVGLVVVVIAVLSFFGLR
jgi:hypothetical protein